MFEKVFRLLQNLVSHNGKPFENYFNGGQAVSRQTYVILLIKEDGKGRKNIRERSLTEERKKVFKELKIPWHNRELEAIE